MHRSALEQKKSIMNLKTLLAVAALSVSVLAALASNASAKYEIGNTMVYRGPLPQVACSLISDTYDGWLDALHVGAGIPLSDSRTFIYVRTRAHQNWVDRINGLRQQGRFCALTEVNVEYVIVAKKYSQGTNGPPADTPMPAYPNSTYLCLKPKTAESNACLWVATEF